MSIFLDAHVHVYKDFPVEQLFDAALDNFIRAATRIGDTESRDYVLCLTEGQGLDSFAEFQKIARPAGSFAYSENVLTDPGAWQYYATVEPNCLIAQNSNGEKLYIIAGSQLISSEQLELLSLCNPVSLPDNTYPLDELAGIVWKLGGVPLLPWGVGKWVGKRGMEVERFISADHDYPVVLGDNGNRPSFWPHPKQLAMAAKTRISIVSGSDPLPLAGHHLRVGSYGGWVSNRRLDENCPVSDVKSIVLQPGCMTPFGKQTGVMQFFRDQLLVNAKKRLPQLFS